ncbi:hypothetical protein D4740_10165 [Actinomyces sp. 2119]|nr:hypothetical protein D4740_10165 [Actinomyces sp. 2119]
MRQAARRRLPRQRPVLLLRCRRSRRVLLLPRRATGRLARWRGSSTLTPRCRPRSPRRAGESLRCRRTPLSQRSRRGR